MMVTVGGSHKERHCILYETFLCNWSRPYTSVIRRKRWWLRHSCSMSSTCHDPWLLRIGCDCKWRCHVITPVGCWWRDNAQRQRHVGGKGWPLGSGRISWRCTAFGCQLVRAFVCVRPEGEIRLCPQPATSKPVAHIGLHVCFNKSPGPIVRCWRRSGRWRARCATLMGQLLCERIERACCHPSRWKSVHRCLLLHGLDAKSS